MLAAISVDQLNKFDYFDVFRIGVIIGVVVVIVNVGNYTLFKE